MIYPDWLGQICSEGDGVVYLDRYVSDKLLAFKVQRSLTKFKLKSVDLKFKARSISIDFNREYKKTILKKKQVDIVFKVKRVIT